MRASLGPYVLDRRLGAGAHGEVWRAEHVPTGTLVAIKRLRHLDSAGARELEREARTLAALSHPAIATVHDVGFADGRPWMALELGEATLADRPPDTVQALRDVLLDVLAGLAHAHARGVLHRDLKPTNVVLVGGRAKVVDFGIAVLEQEEGPLDTSGTPLYVAPEQLEQQRAVLGPWTDLYALGWMAWELAAGRHPWAGRRPHQLLFAQAIEPPPAWPASLPEALGGWVARCLAKAPEDRFRRAADAAYALVRLDLAATPTGPAVRLDSPTFRFGDVSPLPRAERHGDAGVVEPAPAPADWRPSAPWTPAPLPFAGLGLHAFRDVALVGREQLRDALWDAMVRVHAGSTAAIVLRGSLGTGRSALARWLCERAHELGVASDLRLALARDADPVAATARAVSSGIARWGIPAACGPDTRELLAAVAAGAPVRPEARWAALADWLGALGADRPRILWVDDLTPDWVDGVRALVERGAGRTLVVATAEDGVSVPGATTLDVGALAADDAQALVHQLIGLEDLAAARLVERTAGHPGFAVRCVADWVERGWLVPAPRGFRLAEGVEIRLPDDLHAAWQERLAGLGAGQVEALERLAVWEAGGGRGDPRGRELGAIDAPGLLAELDGVPVLADALLRESLLRAAGPRVREHHAACAALLADDAPDRLGLHLLRAGDLLRAGPLLLDGVRRAMERGALGFATELMEAARSCGDDDVAAVLAARLAFLRGDYARCRDLVRRVAKDAGPVGAEAALWLAQALLLTGPAAEAERWAAVAAAGAEPERAERIRADALIQLGRLDEAEAVLSPLRDHPDPMLRAAAWSSSGGVARARGDAIAGELRYRRAVELHAANHDRYREALARIAWAGQLRSLGRLDEAVRAYADGLRLSEAIGSSDVDLARLNLAWMQVGDPAAAVPLFQAALRGLAGIPVLETAVRLGLVTCAGRLRDAAAFEAHVPRLGELLALDWTDPSLPAAMRDAAAAWAHDPERATRLAAILR